MTGLDWLEPLQVLDVRATGASTRPNVRPGGWAFQYANPHYPDLDDTAVVVMAMDRAQDGAPTSGTTPRDRARPRMGRRPAEPRTAAGARSTPTTTIYYLNNIPFADHGALLDPPTEDVTGALRLHAGAARRRRVQSAALARGIDYLRRTQLAGRQLVRPLGHELHLRHLVGAVRAECRRFRPRAPDDAQGGGLAVSIQNADGGWGEDGVSYKLDYHGYERGAEHVVADGMGAARADGGGRGEHPAVARGIAYLHGTQGQDGFWAEERYTATGFPRVFYLRYHGYSKFFPLWALARYRNLSAGRNARFGM